MTTQQNRDRPGVPTGGEFAATVHAEPDVSLHAPARPEPSPIHEAIRSYNEQLRQLRGERDGAHIQAAMECIRRDFPTAVEIRVKNHTSADGRHLEGLVATGLRDGDGNDPTAGDQSWTYRGAETGFCLAHHLMAYELNHAPSAEAFTWDPDTDEWVLPVRDYWKADQP